MARAAEGQGSNAFAAAAFEEGAEGAEGEEGGEEEGEEGGGKKRRGRKGKDGKEGKDGKAEKGKGKGAKEDARGECGGVDVNAEDFWASIGMAMPTEVSMPFFVRARVRVTIGMVYALRGMGLNH